MTKHFVNDAGDYLGGFDGAPAPIGAIEVPIPPLDGLDKWDGSQWIPATPPVAARRITELALRKRFTTDEKVAIEMAAIDDPSKAMAERRQAGGLRVYLADLRSAAFVDLDFPDTRTGVQNLEALGIIGAGRAVQILDAEILPDELPL